MTAAPLIVTLGFDEESFAVFDAARRRHFPPDRNHLPAHLTLFHHLPGDEEAAIAATLREATRDLPPIALAVTGLRFLGYGSAYEIDAPALSRLRQELANGWRDWLTPQDSQKFRPHVTIQNKAPAAAAKALFAQLQAKFAPFEAIGTGLLLWRYKGGPWEAAGEFPFAANA